MIKLARALHASLDSLVFGKNERAPDKEFRPRFEALCDFTSDEKKVTRELLDRLIPKHTANRLSANQETRG